MRILVISKFYPPVIGGVEITVKELCEQFSSQGHQVTALVMTKGPFKEESVGQVKVVRFPQERWLLGGFNLRALFFLKNALGKKEFDMVHIHNFHILLSFQSAIVCRMRSMPYAFSPHYHGKGHTAVRDMLFKVYKRFGRVGLREAKAIACASEFEKEKLLVDFPELRSKALVISPGISPRVRPDVPRDPDLLLYVGRLMSYKGVDHVLRALAVLKERNRRAQLRVVGTGPAEAELKELASNLGLQGQVEFLGEVTEEVLGREYARASCLVLLSSAEAYGLVVAEALASGTPCIVAKLGALTEFTSEPGCFGVESPEDSEKVADLIEQVQDAGGSLKVGPFSQKISYWPEVASRYLELYERILSGDRST